MEFFTTYSTGLYGLRPLPASSNLFFYLYVTLKH